MLVLLAVVALIVRETTASAAHVEASQRVHTLRQRIATVEHEVLTLDARVKAAHSLDSVREIAKRDLGLVDPYDHAIVILDDLHDPPVSQVSTIMPAATARSPRLDFGYLRGWIDLFFGFGTSEGLS